MKNNKIIAVIAAVAVALTAVVCGLFIKNSIDKKGKSETTRTTAEETAEVFLPETQETDSESFTHLYEETPVTVAPSQEQTEPDVSVPTAQQNVTLPESQGATEQQIQGEIPPAAESATQDATQAATKPAPQVTTKPVTSPKPTAPSKPEKPASKEFDKVFKMPVAPQYVPPDMNVDFETAKVLSYKYNPDGGYFYTDDKKCWQQNFGFNEGYDSMAPLGMMNYDTVRVKFVYDNKEWLVQLWKGQYGYAFVGGEVGVYTRKVGSGGTHYNCAKEEDWLNMEMAFVWDRSHDGNYKTIFARDYTKYWWCTGFVPGLETGAPRDQFRLVTHITFESEEMAEIFCREFEKQGFRRVEKLNNNEIDTFVQVGADVAFVWQDIVHN